MSKRTKGIGRTELSSEILEWLEAELRESEKTAQAAHAEALRRHRVELERLQRQQEVMYDDRLVGRIDLGTYDNRTAQLEVQREQIRRRITEGERETRSRDKETKPVTSSLSNRIARLERSCRTHRPPNFLEFQIAALGDWKDENLELLRQACEAQRAGRPLTAEESAILEASDSAMRSESSKWGFATVAECRQWYAQWGQDVGQTAKPKVQVSFLREVCYGQATRSSFPVGNQVGKGRPPGSRNKASIISQELFGEHAEALTRKCIQMGLKGDPSAMRLSMERISLPRKDTPIQFELPKIQSLADLPGVATAVLQAVSRGELSLSEGQKITEMIEKLRPLWESGDLEWRLQRLESAAEPKKELYG